MAKAKKSKNGDTEKTKNEDTEKTEKTSQRINFDVEVYQKIRWVASAKGMKISDYVNAIFDDKLGNVTEKSTIADLRKY